MKWQPIPVFLPEDFHGQKNLAGYSPQDHKELERIEQLTHTHTHTHIFLSEQCKEIEGNNRMGKTRDLFKKIRDTKGIFNV